MKITFIQPNMCSGKPGDCMEPLVFALLRSLTPAGIETAFYDDRIESIPFEAETDAAVLSIGTFTARRAYQIARLFRQRGIPVIAGGFHPTLCPGEVRRFVDCVAIGDAEDTWPQILADLDKGRLRRQYAGTQTSISESRPNRSIFQGKRYAPVTPVQFGRGCPHRCDFCSIHAFYGNSLRERSIETVLEELHDLPRRHILFTDDNLLQNRASASRLLSGIKNMGLHWSCQISLDVARKPAQLEQMAESGCKSATVGFESLNPENLRLMGKTASQRSQEYTQSIRMFHEHGIMVYGTFVLGYDFDTADTFKKTLDFALENKLYLANFNPLTPFPGTALHHRLKSENRLINDPWWLDADFRYGHVSFRPKRMEPEELEEGCYWMRSEFNKHRNIASRLVHNPANRRSAYHAAVYLASNLTSRKEIHRKQNAQLGHPDQPLQEGPGS